MRFVRYNGVIAAVVKSGQELAKENPGSQLEDHLGLWFGETNDQGQPLVCTIPEDYVVHAEEVVPDYRH